MKKEILKKRQEIFKIKLENFINKYGRRPKSGEGFSEGELKKMCDWRRSPEKILVEELKELVCSDKYSFAYSKTDRLVEKKIREVLLFIDTMGRLPEEDSKDKYEKYLRRECLSWKDVREESRIKEYIKSQFITRLLTDEDAAEVAFNWVKSKLVWPSQSSKDIVEKRVYQYLKRGRTRENAFSRYPELLELEEKLRTKRIRRTKDFDYVSFYRTWCKNNGSWPNWKLNEAKDYNLALSIFNRAFDRLKSTLTQEQKDEIKEISITFGYKIGDRSKSPLVVLSSAETKRSKRLYEEFSKLYVGTRTKEEVYRMLSERYNISSETIEKYVNDESKNNMTYNGGHFIAKDKLTKLVIKRIGEENIKSIIDPFAGEQSVYQNEERLGFSFSEKTEIITNDLKFKGHSYNLDARDFLDLMIERGQKFDLVDIDSFDQPLYYISLNDLIKMTNKAFILTLGGMDRTKTQKSIQGLWGITFKKGQPVEDLITNKIREVAALYGKRIKPIEIHHYLGGTYRMAYSIEEI